MIKIIVKKERVIPIVGRHPWVFSGALDQFPSGLTAGTPIELCDPSGNFLAGGYFNPASQIAVRVWSYQVGEEVNQDFFRRRIEKALEWRLKNLDLKKTNAFRLINAENDFIPGLIVDKYADYLVLQIHTAGLEVWKDEIIVALKAVLQPKGIYERSDALASRQQENLETSVGLLGGEVPDLIEILENGFKFLVDVKKGQKTGFFIDQRDKRQALIKYVRDARCLNTFSYTGGFSVYALSGGARQVVSVDTSQAALDLAKENVKLNGFPLAKCEFICQDAKHYLELANPGAFEVVVLDPPAFIKDRRKIKEGLAGYRRINSAGLRILERGGVLVSASCSSHLKIEDFRRMLLEIGTAQQQSLAIVESFTHGIDHPTLIPFTESEYLKCFFIRVGDV